MTLGHLGSGIRKSASAQESTDFRPGQSRARIPQAVRECLQICLIEFRYGWHRINALAPRIQPQARGKLIACSFRLDQEAYQQLQAHAEFIHSDRSYVIREALTFLFRNDRSFQSHLHKRSLGEHDAES